jgi:hypothetical protein
MQSKLAHWGMLSAAIALTTFYHADNVWAISMVPKDPPSMTP